MLQNLKLLLNKVVRYASRATKMHLETSPTSALKKEAPGKWLYSSFVDKTSKLYYMPIEGAKRTYEGD